MPSMPCSQTEVKSRSKRKRGSNRYTLKLRTRDAVYCRNIWTKSSIRSLQHGGMLTDFLRRPPGDAHEHLMNSSSILVVDDDESLRRVIQVQLERVGYRVGTAPNGEKALSLLRQTPYDLAITDLRMPSLSGLDLLRRIRSDHPDVIVVMMTA